ncbi:hypothetical protein BKA70DRAFT_1309149 [Coprinopsis sp. MPI-PUGE-AT-0042]|nr:hypothetical protein BKA70DRAFT_1309149 [Coprinopsis sp. MPI-PUGE-AT-0042]
MRGLAHLSASPDHGLGPTPHMYAARSANILFLVRSYGGWAADSRTPSSSSVWHLLGLKWGRSKERIDEHAAHKSRPEIARHTQSSVKYTADPLTLRGSTILWFYSKCVASFESYNSVEQGAQNTLQRRPVFVELHCIYCCHTNTYSVASI